MAGDIPRCMAIAIEASGIENEAMELDRAGTAAEAAEAYRRAAARLLEAVEVCPGPHPDRRVMKEHAKEVIGRAAYLEALEGDAPAVPLEDHIHGVQLTMGSAAAPAAGAAADFESWTVVSTHGDSKVVCAAAAIGGATGLLLSGPLSAAALGAAAAYATTREDSAGSAARKVGTVGVRAVHRARSINEDYRISDRAKAVGQSAFGQVAALDSRYGLTDSAKQATAQTTRALSEFNEKHKVADRLSWGLGAAGCAFSSLVSKATRH